MLLEHKTFESFINERASRITVKRKYGKRKAIDAQLWAPVRNDVLSFIKGKGKVTIEDLRVYFKKRNLKFSKNTTMNWVHRNRHFVQRFRADGTRYYKITPLAGRVLARTAKNESLILEDAATVANVPGMGNAQPPSTGKEGSGDTFNAIGSPGEIKENEKMGDAMSLYNKINGRNNKNDDKEMNKLFRGSKISSFFIYRATQMSNNPERAYDSFVKELGKGKVDNYIEDLLPDLQLIWKTK